MKELASQVVALFSQYGYGAVFVGVMLDNAGIPLAGELTLLLGGSLVLGGNLQWLPAVLTATAAALLSDSFWYAAGRLGSARMLKLYCHFSFGSCACMEKTENMLAHFGPRSLLFARFVPGFRTFAPIMAGISGLSYGKFLLFDGIGSLLWSSTMVTVGMLVADRLYQVFAQMESARSALLTLAGLALLIYAGMKIRTRLRHGKAQYVPPSAATGKEA